jgi:hypothetical protein
VIVGNNLLCLFSLWIDATNSQPAEGCFSNHLFVWCFDKKFQFENIFRHFRRMTDFYQYENYFISFKRENFGHDFGLRPSFCCCLSVILLLPKIFISLSFKQLTFGSIILLITMSVWFLNGKNRLCEAFCSSSARATIFWCYSSSYSSDIKDVCFFVLTHSKVLAKGYLTVFRPLPTTSTRQNSICPIDLPSSSSPNSFVVVIDYTITTIATT